MRLPATRLLRLALVGVLVGSTVAIVWSLLSRNDADPPSESVSFLSPDVSHRTTEFEYLERRKGRPVFKVSARTSTETVEGLRRLDRAQLSHFDALGKISEAMSGRRAVYNREKKKIEFLEDVSIQLPDGMEVEADRVRADLNDGIVLIEENFGLKKGKMSGKGRSLVYDIAARKVKVSEGLQVDLTFGPDSVKAQAKEATYWLSRGLIELRNTARLSNQQSLLTARGLDLRLDNDRRLQKIQAFGQARFSSADQEFSGERMEIDWVATESKVRFRISADETVQGDHPRALYVVGAGPLMMRLEATRIGGVLAVDGSGSAGLQMEKLWASGDVIFRAPSRGLKEARAGIMRADFSQGGRSLRNLELDGGFSTTGVRDEQRQLEEFRGKTLKAEWSPEGALKWARASRRVTLRWQNGLQSQELSSPYEIGVRTLEGGRRETRCVRECVFRSFVTDSTRTLRTPLLTVVDSQGQLESLRAEGGVQLETRGPEGHRSTESRELVARYEHGRLQEAVQSGDFRLSQQEADFELIAQADRAVHEQIEETLRLDGGKPTLIYRASGQSDETRTTATEFLLQHSADRIVGQDRVTSVSTGPAGTVVVVAGRMEVDSQSGWVTYSGNPRIVHGTNTINGRLVRYHPGQGRLVVQEEVVGVFVGEGGRDTYRVRSRELTYDPGEGRVLWQGQVRLQGTTIDMSAPKVEGILTEEGNEFERIVALGEVRIIEAGRQARGETATYYPSQRKVILRGEQAEVFQPGKGKASGRQLTFYLGDETLVIEDPG